MLIFIMEQEFIVKKKGWYKRKWFFIVLILAVLAGGGVYRQFRKNSQKSQYETVKVIRGALKQTVDATGNVESADELDLRFETAGRIGRIYKQINDSVKSGEIIAELELGQLNAAIAQAQANLNKQLAGDTSEYLASLEAAYNQAQASLGQTQATADSDVHIAEAALQTAENNLKLVEGEEQSRIVQDAYGDMVALLRATQNILSGSLTEADNVLGVDNTLANDDFESVLSALKLDKLNIAKNKYMAAKAVKIDVDTAVNGLSQSSSHEVIDHAAELAEDGLSAMKDLLFAVDEALGNTVPLGSLSQAELDTLKTDNQTERTAIAAKYTSLLDQTQAIVNAKNSYASYKIAYDKAVKDLADAKKKAEADVAGAQAAADKAKATWDDGKNPPREVDVAGYRAALWEAAANRDKSRIIAPIDGAIGKVPFKQGEYVGVQDAVVKLISPHFEIKVDIPETDIVKINIHNPAEIKIDAYGDEVKFQGNVLQVESGQTVIQDVVYYKVIVSLEGDLQHRIFNGMTANVVFSTERKDNVLFIPQRAVRSNNGKYVKVLENKQVKDAEIKTGLKGDGGMVEVVEGLSEGQEIIIGTVEN